MEFEGRGSGSTPLLDSWVSLEPKANIDPDRIDLDRKVVPFYEPADIIVNSSGEEII